MTKNFYDLLVGIVTAVEGLIGSFCIYFGVTGKIDGKTAAAIADSAVVVGGAVLGVCARFIKEDVTKKKTEKKL